MARLSVIAAAIAGALLAVTARAAPAPVDTVPGREYSEHRKPSGVDADGLISVQPDRLHESRCPAL